MFKVKVENKTQLDIVLNFDSVSEIILSRDSFAESDLPKLVDKIKKTKKSAWILMERISRYDDKMEIRRGEHCEPASLRLSTDKIYDIQNLDGIIIQNLDSFAYMLRRINRAANKKLLVELNYTMNCYNRETKLVHETLYNEKRENVKDVPLLFTAPLELNVYELSDVGYDTFVLYSYIDTMVTANCLRKNTEMKDIQGAHIARPYEVAHIARPYEVARIARPHNGAHITRSETIGTMQCEPLCKNRYNFNEVQDFTSYIIDRKGEKLYYKTYCKYCYNKIFNTTPLYLIDKVDEIEDMYKKYLVDSKSALKYRLDFSFENENEVKNILSMKKPDEFTRGHFKTSIK